MLNVNNKGITSLLGMSLLVVAFILIIVLFVTIDPSKESLDDARDTSSLNCKGTDSFNQTAYDLDENNTIAKLTRRPTCFVTGISMIYFVFAFLIAVVAWVVRNWRKISR